MRWSTKTNSNEKKVRFELGCIYLKKYRSYKSLG